METTEKIMDIELMDSMPAGIHKVIIDTYEERQFDEYTYLDFQLIGLEGDALDKQITHGVPYPKSGKTTGRSKLRKLVKAAIPEAKGTIDFENDLLQKEILVEIVEDGPYVKVERVWASSDDPPEKSPEPNQEDTESGRRPSEGSVPLV